MCFFFVVVVVVGEPDAFQLGQPNEGLVVDVQQDGAPFAVERLDAEVLQARKSNEGPRWKCPDFAVLNLQGFQLEQASKVVGAEVQLEEEDVGAGEVKGIDWPGPAPPGAPKSGSVCSPASVFQRLRHSERGDAEN